MILDHVHSCIHAIDRGDRVELWVERTSGTGHFRAVTSCGRCWAPGVRVFFRISGVRGVCGVRVSQRRSPARLVWTQVLWCVATACQGTALAGRAAERT